MDLFKVKSFRILGIHVLAMLIFSLVAMLLLFYLYLPYTTKHGQTITVPDIKNMKTSDLEPYLTSLNLRFQIIDSSYEVNKQPHTVISQNPEPNTLVKENRKIYVIVSTKTVPKVIMPNLINSSLKSSKMILKSFGLLVGEIKNRPHFTNNVVLKQSTGDRVVNAEKGTKIDLVISNGLGNNLVEIPNLDGLSLDKAKVLLSALGLEMGSQIFDGVSSGNDGIIHKQKPAFSTQDSIQIGSYIDVWVFGKDTRSGQGPVIDTE